MASRYDIAKRLYNPGQPKAAPTGGTDESREDMMREALRRNVLREEERRKALFEAELVIAFICGVIGAIAYALLC